LKSLQSLDIISSITALLNDMVKKPLEITYDWDVQPELLGLVKARFPNIHVVKKEQSRLMVQEKNLYSILLNRWIERNNKNWLYDVHVIQAVINRMPL